MDLYKTIMENEKYKELHRNNAYFNRIIRLLECADGEQELIYLIAQLCEQNEMLVSEKARLTMNQCSQFG